jgi:hypothetical protein
VGELEGRPLRRPSAPLLEGLTMAAATLTALAEVFDLADDELSDAARKAAGAVHRLARAWQSQGTSDSDILRTLRKFTRRHHVELPAKDSFQQVLNRVGDAIWWRRALRKRFRTVEHAAILAGRVHAKASPYSSDMALRRAERDRRRVAELLESLEAVNQSTGQVIRLDELAAASQANPANRRKAMAVRIKGIEQFASDQGMQALFFTITCPSRMHARLERSGQENPRYDGTGPRQAQAYLCALWGRAMRKLAHSDVRPFGLRVVEPHHDGCPHWHVLAFVKPEHEAELTATLRAYALADSPNEPGAATRRFECERIDHAKGSALGYVLKYVSKSIDGAGVDADNETDQTGEQAARRIVTWARTWGIRQFQFFGVPAITPTRELFRVEHRDSLPSKALQAAHDATKANDYAAWLRVLDAYAMSFQVDYTSHPSTRYAGEVSHSIAGLTAEAADLATACQFITRTEEWRIQPRGEAALSAEGDPPWTRFNNSAGSLKSTTCSGPASDPNHPAGERGRRRRRPAPPPGPRGLPPAHQPTRNLPC